MPATGAFPSLSQLLAWPTEHLTEGAEQWEYTAGRWYEATAQVWQDSLSADWEGQAADALHARTYADKVKVGGLVDQLQEAAKTARIGATDLSTARSRMRYAVEDAHAAGFVVSEDLHVTDRLTGGSAAVMAARQAQAQTFAADIGQRAAQLVALDQEVAGKIASALTGIGKFSFDEPASSAAPEEPSPPKHNGIQLVDNKTWKKAPAQPVPPDPEPGPLPPINTGEDVRKVLDPLQNGGKRGPNGVGAKPGVKELWDAASVKRMWEYLTRNATASPGRPGYDGPTRVLPDGTEIGLRDSGKGWGDTIDVWYPDGTDKKIHVPYTPPLVSAPPQLPPAGDPAPLPLPPPPVGHAPVTLPPTTVVDPNSLPPWLINPSPPGFVVSPTQPPPLTPWDTPGSAPPPVPVPPAPAPGSSPGGSPLLPDLAHDLAEAGEKAGAGVLAGAAIIGGLLAGGVTSSGQIAR